MATADAMVAVFDAKYHYEFWRPITAIRNGDEDGNPDTERDATWEPLGPTPMHPEYPCAHCIVAGSAGTVMQAFSVRERFEFTLYADGPRRHRIAGPAFRITSTSRRMRACGRHLPVFHCGGGRHGSEKSENHLQNYLRPVK